MASLLMYFEITKNNGPRIRDGLLTNLASILDGGFISLKDERFVDDLLTDLSDYLRRNDVFRVLLFPPLNGYNRLLIHKTVECEFSDLVTFSVGTGASRRTAVAFKIACSRGPRGIQLMNSPASPVPRGRGRGRQKEMSSSERVNQWVNQREAKRLNKERWANRGSGDDSYTGNESDIQRSANQETAELDIGSDRSVAKKQNVRLYVPPSLRAKKESESVRDLLDSGVDSATSMMTQNQDTFENSGTANRGEAGEESAIRSDFEDQQKLYETSRTKQRGRGRRKPEVEIYVPRALRAATKHESKSAGIQTSDGPENLPLEAQEKSKSVYCDNLMNTNSLPSQHSPPQSSVFYEELPACISHSHIPHQEYQPYSNSESYMPSQSNFQTVLQHDLATKKVKYELTGSSLLPPVTDASASASKETISDEQPHIESAGNSLTFEFYDPAVIAFLPPSGYVQKSYNTNSSYCVDNSKLTSEGSQHNATKCSVPSVSAVYQPQVQHTTAYNCQSQSLIQNDTQYNFPTTCTETDKESFSENTHSEDKDGDFLNEQISTIGSPKSANNEDNRRSGSCDVLSDSLTPMGTTPDIPWSGITTEFDINEDLITVSHKTDKVELGAASDNLIDVTHDSSLPVLTSSEEFSHEDVSATIQQSSHNSSNRPSSAVAVGSELSNSETNDDNSVKHRDNTSNEHVENDEDDTWDTLFDDNGECLDETVMKELTDYVGKVAIDKPKINYLNYEPKRDRNGFSGHILEIYDFSPDLATCDLISAFREFSSRGFDVKWVDDTHALGIFSGAVAANEALKMIHPLFKVRPLSEASRKGQSKAKHCQEFLQPYKARPETTSMAARRLVAGALGMNTQVSREIREQERKKLKEAKEKRRQERQQKVDVWDGSYGKCAMDNGDTESR